MRRGITFVVGLGLTAGMVVAIPSAATAGAPAEASASGVPTAAAAEGKQPDSRISTRLEVLASPGVRSATPKERARALSLPEQGAGSIVQPSAGTVLVEVRAAGSTAAASAAVVASGGRVTHVSDRYATVTAVVPVASLSSLGRSKGVAYVGEVLQPETGATAAPSAAAGTTGLPGVITPAPCGSKTSEGDTQLNALAARNTYGIDGTGVKVGVLSDTYNKGVGLPTNAAADIAAGNLPGPGNPCGRTTPVSVLDDSVGSGSDEGRAMLQIVHDLAPGSTLSFATAFTGLTAFADNIRSLRTAGANVIVDDVFYFVEPFYQQGPVDVAINDVTAAGARYFTLAGNHNRIVGANDVGTWEAPAYRPTPCPAAVLTKYGATPPIDCLDLNPGAGADSGRGFTLANNTGIRLNLQWAEPWYGVGTDLDLFLVDTAAGTVVATSWAVNPGATGSQTPYELFTYNNVSGSARNYDIVVARYSGSGTPRVKTMFMQGTSGLSNVEYPVSAGGDIVGPSIYGHSGTSTGISVGAVPYNDSTTPETYTSRGPMTTLFGPVVGTSPAAATAPVVLNKPDVAATDGGANPFFGTNAGGGTYRFYGTSAAAPHAAAVGALMLQKNPALTAAQLRAILAATASPVANGTPASVGGGLVNALGAVGVGSSAPTAPVITAATPGNGQVALSFTGGGAYVTGYLATCTSSNGGAPGSAGGAGSPIVVGGLTNGRAYSCQVAAQNPLGSTASAAVGVALPDIVAPTLATRALPAVSLGTPRVTWTASDDTGIASFRVRVRTAPNGGRLGSWVTKPSLPGTARSYLVSGARPGGICVEVTAVDGAGNASAPSVRCTSFALDDRALAASRGGWVRPVVRSAYFRTLSISARTGAFLVKTRTYGAGLTLLVNKAPGAGTLGVYVNNRLKAVVKLTARRAALKQLVSVRTGRMTNATVVVKVLVPGRGVQVDGLAVSP